MSSSTLPTRVSTFPPPHHPDRSHKCICEYICKSPRASLLPHIIWWEPLSGSWWLQSPPGTCGRLRAFYPTKFKCINLNFIKIRRIFQFYIPMKPYFSFLFILCNKTKKFFFSFYYFCIWNRKANFDVYSSNVTWEMNRKHFVPNHQKFIFSLITIETSVNKCKLDGKNEKENWNRGKYAKGKSNAVIFHFSGFDEFKLWVVVMLPTNK